MGSVDSIGVIMGFSLYENMVMKSTSAYIIRKTNSHRMHGCYMLTLIYHAGNFKTSPTEARKHLIVHGPCSLGVKMLTINYSFPGLNHSMSPLSLSNKGIQSHKSEQTTQFTILLSRQKTVSGNTYWF